MIDATVAPKVGFISPIVSWDHLSPPQRGRVTPPESTRYGRLALLPWPACDERPAPLACSAGSYARDRNCPAPPRAHSSSSETVSLWTRPGSYVLCADCVGAWSRYAALPHSY